MITYQNKKIRNEFNEKLRLFEDICDDYEKEIKTLKTQKITKLDVQS